MENLEWQSKPYKIEICDGCGDEKEIVYVTEFGQGFCLNCIHEK